MEQFKKAKVFVLETNQSPQIGDICYSRRTGYFINEGNTSVTNVINMLFVKSTDIKTYKMYITEYKEIKDKDYFIVRYNENTFVLGQRTKNTMDVIADKVIAILGNHIYPPCDGHCGNEYVCIYPHPSPDFVKKWVDEANEDNIITDVLIEYEYLLNDNTVIPYWKLKVNPKNNTITIRKVKENFTKNEVISLCDDAYKVGYGTAVCEETNQGKEVSFKEWLYTSVLDVEPNKIYTKEEVIKLLEKFTSFIWSEVGIHYPISLGKDAKDIFINREL